MPSEKADRLADVAPPIDAVELGLVHDCACHRRDEGRLAWHGPYLQVGQAPQQSGRSTGAISALWNGYSRSSLRMRALCRRATSASSRDLVLATGDGERPRRIVGGDLEARQFGEDRPRPSSCEPMTTPHPALSERQLLMQAAREYRLQRVGAVEDASGFSRRDLAHAMGRARRRAQDRRRATRDRPPIGSRTGEAARPG